VEVAPVTPEWVREILNDEAINMSLGTNASLEAARYVEKLIAFGQSQGMLEKLDEIAARNALLDLLKIPEPWGEDCVTENVEAEAVVTPGEGPVHLLRPLLEYASNNGLIPDRTTSQLDLFDARLMGLLMPRPGEVVRKFRELADSEGMREATDWFYRLSGASNYIRWDRIRNNEYWRTATPYGELEVTINLSKPEKDPKEIAAERAAPVSGYPQCLLCLENVGYAGRVNHPARQNHRVIPVMLGGSAWYMQYSPYLYYNEHCILFDERHTPMNISGHTFVKLLDFVEQYPHYFAGSNADLPIVGGSILSHDHFQGGRHVFPMAQAPVEQPFTHPEYPSSSIGIVQWPMSVVRVSSPDRQELVELAKALLAHWREYSDESASIAAYSDEGGENVPHNTITPIARRNEAGSFELDLVLRNNRRSEEHPDGIFHPHAELHHIKKENIGLIEVMGLAVLPGRLKLELAQIRELLTGVKPYEPSSLMRNDHPLHKHATWVESMIKANGASMSESEAEELLRAEVGHIFLRVLLDAGVFKRNEKGREAFQRVLTKFGAVTL
jgi:UDPglucose--hexose-1-phosphate uridylyltransferase